MWSCDQAGQAGFLARSSYLRAVGPGPPIARVPRIGGAQGSGLGRIRTCTGPDNLYGLVPPDNLQSQLCSWERPALSQQHHADLHVQGARSHVLQEAAFPAPPRGAGSR